MSHTKGPWRIGKIATHVESDSGEGICSTGGYQNNTENQWELNERQQANARLIAAAPDLLEALEKIATVKCIQFAELPPDNCGCVGCLARAAIRKAKGEM